MSSMEERAQTLSNAIMGLLTVKEKKMVFSEEACLKIFAVVEAAAHLDDVEWSTTALAELVRLMLALEAEGHESAAQTIRATLVSSAAAMSRLERVLRREERSAERFRQFANPPRRRDG